MAKPTGYLEYPRVEDPIRPAEVRSEDFAALHEPLNDAARAEQAARCMNCGVPYCQSDYGCPLHNLIPEWNDLLYQGHTHEALKRLLKTSPFPEFTGRVCPALCEKACMMAETDGATTNRDNELYLIETGFALGRMAPRAPRTRTGKRVAVIGSGPSGLAAADYLNRRGHLVTVFERADEPGGLLMYGIPNMKLPKSVVRRRVRLMAAEGVVFYTGVEVDAETVADYDAALLCGGARKPRGLNVPGAGAKGVHYAVDFLTEATRAVLNGRKSEIDAAGKHVVVVGGGDTGNDCVGTCIRQGCKSMVELELMPAAPTCRNANNPWPEWPRTLRTDYGQLESAARFGEDPRLFETTVESIEAGADGRIRAVNIAGFKNGAVVPGTTRKLPCDLLLIAAGFVGCDPGSVAAFDVKLTPRGSAETIPGTHMIAPGLYTAGDFRTGQSLVVRAIADGLAAAKEVDTYLTDR